jgi:ketosteroid isomerase-like protein
MWHSPINGTVHGRAAVVQQVQAGFVETDDFSTETLASETRAAKTVAHVRNRGRRKGEQLDSHQWLFIQTRDGLVSDVDIHVDDPEAVERFWSTP